MDKVLFLDFDVVLHASFSEPEHYFERGRLLVDAIARAPVEPLIVISSSWRFRHACPLPASPANPRSPND